MTYKLRFRGQPGSVGQNLPYFEADVIQKQGQSERRFANRETRCSRLHFPGVPSDFAFVRLQQGTTLQVLFKALTNVKMKRFSAIIKQEFRQRYVFRLLFIIYGAVKTNHGSVGVV